MDSKPWYKSKAIWLGAVACLYGVYKFVVGGEFNIEDLTAIYAGLATIFLRFGID